MVARTAVPAGSDRERERKAESNHPAARVAACSSGPATLDRRTHAGGIEPDSASSCSRLAWFEETHRQTEMHDGSTSLRPKALGGTRFSTALAALSSRVTKLRDCGRVPATRSRSSGLTKRMLTTVNRIPHNGSGWYQRAEREQRNAHPRRRRSALRSASIERCVDRDTGAAARADSAPRRGRCGESVLHGRHSLSSAGAITHHIGNAAQDERSKLPAWVAPSAPRRRRDRPEKHVENPAARRRGSAGRSHAAGTR